MAITKKFQELVTKVCGSNVGELLRQIGETATKYAYSAQDAEPAQYALDTLPDAWRDPLATWLRARGLIVGRKAVGSSRYVVGETDDAGILHVVKTQKRQSRAMQEALTEPVLKVVEQTVRVEKKIELKGSASFRAGKAAESAVARLKKTDPDAAALLNDVLTRNTGTNLLVLPSGSIELNAEEVTALTEYLTSLRAEAVLKVA